jgi:hypothetical protein
MATSEVISSTYTSSDGKSLTLGYDPSGNILVQATIQIDGNFFQWSSIEDFRDFVNNVVAMNDVASSPSGGEGILLLSPFISSIPYSTTLNLVPSGGTGIGHTFSMLAGTGSVDSSGLFTAPATTETDIVKIIDSNGNIAYAFIAISETGMQYIPGFSGSPDTDSVTD